MRFRIVSSNLDLILEEWEASLKQKDRSAGAVGSNFDELFEKLKAAGATFEEAHAILPKAIKMHQPPLPVARNTYKSTKMIAKVAAFTEKEFIERWNKDIADKGTNSFFSIFPRPKQEDEEDPGPKVYGNMSAKEYRLQRRYADQFPVLNTEELEKRMVQGTYNPMEDIADVLGKKDSKDGSTK
jgi:hypothetical protein